MNRTAFIELAKGNFDTGLKILEQDSDWQDSLNDLEGPFKLEFPGVSGWGEGLMLASLLKRYAANQKRIRVFAPNQQLRAILEQDQDSFEVLQSEDSQLRTPLAILKEALTGNLLEKRFIPLCLTVQQNEPTRSRPRIGIAWSSVNKRNECILEKTVLLDRFLGIIEGIDADFISFQRKASLADNKFSAKFQQHRISADLHETSDKDDTESIKKICEAIRQLDCMLTISTTTAHIAASLEIPVVLLAMERDDGHQWFWQAQANHQRCIYPTVQHIHLGEGEKDDWWKNCLQPATESLKGILESTNRLANRT